MVLSSLRAPRSGVYVIQDVCESRENLDAALLRRAWRSVAERHAALRTQIAIEQDGSIRQSAVASADPPWLELDWTSVGDSDWADALTTWLGEDRQQGFRFGSEVPLRITLLRRQDGLRTLILTAHHVLVDGRSLRNVWQEWFAFYDHFAGGGDVALPTAASFRDHLDWLERQDLSDARRLWQERLAGLSQTSGLIVDRLYRASRSGEPFAKHDATVPEGLSQELTQLASSLDITVHTLVQGAWALLLSRYGGQSDVVFGVVRDGRRSPLSGAGASVGMFINTLPLRVAVPREGDLRPWLKEIRRQWVSLQALEHTPASRIREWCGFPVGVPLFDTTLIYDHEPVNESLRALGGSWLTRSVTRRQRTDAPLTLCAYGKPELRLELIYDTRVFSERTIAAMGGHVRALLRSFAEGNRAGSAISAVAVSRLAELNMLDAAEERQMQAWNQTAVPRPAGVCVHHLFEEHVRRNPDHVAVDRRDGSLSYGELNRRANQLARVIRQKGARPDDPVAIVMHRSPEAITAVLAVLKAGAAFLPLSPDLPQERLAWMLSNAHVRLAICRDADLAGLGSLSCELLVVDRMEPELLCEPEENLPDSVDPSNAAYVIYTSGSTGKPKAIVVTHRSLVNYTLAAAGIFDLSERDRRLQFASLTGDIFVSEIINYMSCGATLVSCLSQPGNSVREFIRLLDEHRITITGVPTPWWNEWVAGMSEGDFRLPETLRAVIVGMERVHPATLAAWKAMVGTSVRLFNAYGPAEATSTATIYESGSSEWEGGDIVPIGKPLANVTAYVLDGGGTRLPVGVPGELYIGGAGVARGYLNAPDLTAERFVVDPLGDTPDARLYRTGDLAFFLPDGNLMFAGRADRQVKIRGFRIELDEIEAVLAEHPAVRECAVVLQDQPGRQNLVAYFTSNGPDAPNGQELRLHLARRLPDYMVPAAWIALPHLPLTSNGKVDRLSLPAYVPDAREPGGTLIPPSTPTESRLCELWNDVLGLERVSVTDNFFALGGDSLRATRLITLIQRDLQKEIPFALLLRAPTVALLATALDAGETAGPFPPALVSIQPYGSRPPVYCVHGSGPLRHLARHLGTDQPFLGIPRLDTPEAKHCSLEETAARYVVLLRTFQPHGPYVLSGCCYAGVIAYEMARQLRESGESVPLLVLFDAVNPATWGFRSWRTIRSMLGYHARVLRSLPISESWDYVEGRLTSVGNLLRGRIRRAWSRPSLAVQASPEVDAAYIQAIGFDRYSPKPYSGPTVLCCGEWARPYVDPRYGWGDLVGGSLDVIRLPGGHLEMLQEPLVETLARQLDTRLRRASRSANRAETVAR